MTQTYEEYMDSLYRQPRQPCGYNADDNNGDEVDGAGTNWSLVPAFTDMFVPLQPLIITEDMLSVFDGCADYVVPRQNNVITFPREVRTQVMRKMG